MSIRRVLGDIYRLVLNFVTYVGFSHYCPLCEQPSHRFVPNRWTEGRKIIEQYHIVAMGLRKQYRCPWCKSSDKERLVWMYLTSLSTAQLDLDKKMRVLHVSPEPNTMRRLKAKENIDYVSGDKFEGDEKYTDGRYGDSMYLDITKMPFFEDGEFDLIICNHVLEHVPADTVAMKELYRVMKKGGMAILQVPVSWKIKKSIEGDTKIPEERIAKYGQADHVRIYAGDDYIQRLKDAGFRVSIVRPTEIGKIGDDGETFGINPEEVVFVAEK